MLVIFGRCDHNYLEAVNFFGFGIINLREDDLLGQAQSVVAKAIEGSGFDPAKIFDLRKYYSTQFIEEIKHFDSAQCNADTNGVTGTDFETGDATLGTPHFGGETSQGREFGTDSFDIFLRRIRFGNSDIDDDFDECGRGKNILNP